MTALEVFLYLNIFGAALLGFGIMFIVGILIYMIVKDVVDPPKSRWKRYR